MEAIKEFFLALVNSPHYSYGWVLLAVLAILPAIVSANLVQLEISKILNRKSGKTLDMNALLINTLILAVSIGVMAYAFYLYVWK